MGERLKPGDPDYRPARNYRWEPFKPGNEVGLRHGAFSPRKVDPLATELVEAAVAQAMVDGAPTSYLADPSYRPALWSWGRAEAQAQLLTEYLIAAAEITGDGIGDLDADRVKTAYNLLHKAEARADRLRSELGLTPLSRARLGRDVAAGQVDMARVMAALDDGEGAGA